MENSATPRVSIGVPVYNGAETLRHALDSILGQTFTDLEVLVCDNASEDRTLDIAREYAAEDERVRVFPSDTNLGARANFNRAVDMAAGEYFKWAAHDDWIAPTFVERCVDELDAAPEAILCYTSMCRPDAEEGTRRAVFAAEPLVRSDKAHARFAEALAGVPYFAIFGLYRTSALKRTGLLPNCPEPDFMALAEAALQGPFRQVPEVLFFARTPKGWKERNVWVWLDPDNAEHRRARIARIVRELLTAVRSTELPTSEKLMASMRIPGPLLAQTMRGKVRQIQRDHQIGYARGERIDDDFIASWQRVSATSRGLALQGGVVVAGDPMVPSRITLARATP